MVDNILLTPKRCEPSKNIIRHRHRTYSVSDSTSVEFGFSRLLIQLQNEYGGISLSGFSHLLSCREYLRVVRLLWFDGPLWNSHIYLPFFPTIGGPGVPKLEGTWHCQEGIWSLLNTKKTYQECQDGLLE